MPFESEAQYAMCVADPDRFSRHLCAVSARHPELFPLALADGSAFHDRYRSSKFEVVLRRIELASSGDVFLVRPSFLMPYLVGRTDNIEQALYLRPWVVPFDALAHVFGRDAMFWYRAWCALGRPTIVGTTIKDASRLPGHLVVDEKHISLAGGRVYIPTTVASGCILGTSLVASASTKDLTGYGEFADEARKLDENYTPETVCADGWEATASAWRVAFARVAIVLCFSHSVIKMREKCRKNAPLRTNVLEKAWEVYKATTRAELWQRLRRFREWAEANLATGSVREVVLTVCAKGPRFAIASYDYPGAARTSSAVDRLMNYPERLLYATRYFHGTRESERLSVRAIALLWNFHAYGARLRRGDQMRCSPT